GQLLNRPEVSARRRQRQPSHEIQKRTVVKRAVDPRKHQERLQLAGESETIPVAGEVQGLLTEMVASKEEIPGARVENAKGEHAAKPACHFLAQIFIEMNEHLGVAPRAKAMTLPAEFLAELNVVVYLAIQKRADRPVLVPNWLRAPLKIDDRKS